MTIRTTFLLVPLALLAACGDGSNDNWVAQDNSDRGEICLFSNPADADTAFGTPSNSQSYGANQPVYVRFIATGCLSSSCSRNVEVTCSAALNGTEVAVDTSATWEENQGEGVACTTDCGILHTTCTTAPLPAGSYDVTFAGQTTALIVPSTVLAICLERSL